MLESSPLVKDKYPFIYLERGRLEIDVSSLKWLDSAGNIVRLPISNAKYVVVTTWNLYHPRSSKNRRCC